MSFAGVVLGFIAGALYDGKLAAHFQQTHPGIWADLAQHKIKFADGDSQGAAMHEYLLRGKHKKLLDTKLNSMVFKFRILVAIFFCSAMALMLVQDRVSITTYRACLPFL
ncbi:hypothetical protein [Polaromonas sp. P5_D5]